jgi:hypothetical protein
MAFLREHLTIRQIADRLGNPKLYHSLRRIFKDDPRVKHGGIGKVNKHYLVPIAVFEEKFGGRQ